MKDRRFIEETFPVKEVSAESAREKTIRHGSISTVHLWWARRPLASSRATNFAALIPAGTNGAPRKQMREFVADLSKWENSSNRDVLEKARRSIRDAYGGRAPRVLDPYAGGGSISLEALRLGCEVYSADYNPVAVLIQKATIEYPLLYGKGDGGRTEWTGLRGSSGNNSLLEEVKQWGKWVLEATREEMEKFYPSEDDGSIPLGYVWARTIPCQNPSCEADIPLMHQFWLAKTGKKNVSLLPRVRGREIKFSIVGTGHEDIPLDFNPDKGTTSRAVARCLKCGSMVDARTTRRLFVSGDSSQRMLAVILRRPKEKGRIYRAATSEDEETFRNAEAALEVKRGELLRVWGLEPVPDEPLPPERAVGSSGFRVILYGMEKWGDLFNARQKLVLITFVDRVRNAYQKMLDEGYEEDLAKVVCTYLGLAVSRLADHNSVLQTYQPSKEAFKNTFTRQALPMVWDYAEINPLLPSGGWSSTFVWLSHFFATLKEILDSDLPKPEVFQATATALPYQDNFFDAVFTDPPYYDNVAYGDLSDFFYVWLKRTIGHLHPGLFSTPLTPKSKEIIEDPGRSKDKNFFEKGTTEAFQEIHRVLRPGGIALIVYAHKSTEGWETLINSLLDSGLIITAAWPISTEMRSRLNANQTASLASAIYIVGRKMDRLPTGLYSEIKEELREHLDMKLQRLWEEGIGGANFFIAAIGSAIEVFGKYEKIIDFEGRVVRGDRLLEDVRLVSTNYAVRQILEDGFAGEIFPLTRLYVLWRWVFGEARVQFDDARKLAQSSGIDIAQEWNGSGFVRKEKEFVRLLGPHERTIEGLENSQELIDVLHLALLLWEKSKLDEMTTVLSDSGYAGETLFRVAQAVSQTLPNESQEKKLLDGFLAGRERVREEVRRKTVQTKLM